jgi:hypothetical protein
MNRKLWPMIVALCAAACAPFTAVGGKLALPGQGFEVDLSQGWYRVEVIGKSHLKNAKFPFEALLLEEDSEALFLTRDGLFLQCIRIERTSVEKELPHTKQKFTPEMPPHDAAELELDNVRSDPNAFNFDVLERAPASVGGKSGFRLVYTWKTKDGLRFKRLHYGFVDGKWVYRLTYQAPARHYFDQDLATFEQIRESFRLLTIPA